VLGVDEDDLVVLVGRVLVDPVRVQHAQVGAASADALLGRGLEGALVLELVDTLVGGLACLGRFVSGDMLIMRIFSRSGFKTCQKRGLVVTYHRWHP
jgi:hypothetical protein